MFARSTLLLGAVVLLIGCDANQSNPITLNALYENPDNQAFKRADQVVPIEFPRDHGPHLDFQTEWWYLVGIVQDADQREFGFQYTLFRQALTPKTSFANAWRTGQTYMAHFAIADIANEDHVAFERFSRGHERLAGVAAVPFRAYLEDWSLHSHEKTFTPLELKTQANGYALDLSLTATKPPVLHGDAGLSWKSATNASYYYSIPRLQASGTLSTPENDFKVRGIAWIDREWSTGILDRRYRGWHWLTLFLDNRQDAVLFSLVPHTDDVLATPVGMLIDERGDRVRLEPDDWQLQPTRFWGAWPVAWDLTLQDRVITIEPAFDNQEMSTTVRYWEGVVYVLEDGERIGEGFLELTGY